MVCASLYVLMPFVVKAEEAEQYVALGDSLAAGQTPYTQIDSGYTDFIAMQLARSGKLASFSKELAFPGYTVANVLASVQTARADELVKNATLITISAGANDLLRLVSHDPTAGTLSFSQLPADFALNNVRKDMALLLETVSAKAPQAEIYVMGYYFPYTSVHDEQKQGTLKQLQTLNLILQQQADLAGANFISVFEQFEEEATNYLPNVSDVHPNQNGYRVMANEFLQGYVGNNSLAMSYDQLPEPNPLTFEEILQMQQQETKQIDTVTVSHETPRTIEYYVTNYGYQNLLSIG